ncbi:hypothetical protein N7507_005620 [Penicillium longicatenatum]|nr:hypothetical protein N7507_005620 [Penicillium longicatenatum]
MFIQGRAIPLDSVVVVIGANGFIGLETCEKLLVAGYRVDVVKDSVWMHNLFDEKWPGNSSWLLWLTVKKGALLMTPSEASLPYRAAGVIYVSTPIVFYTDPTNVVVANIRSTINTLEAAAKAGVQRYILSSSSKAVETTTYDDTPRYLTAQTYNWESILKAYQGSNEETFKRMLYVYSAGRTLAELAFWSWIAENCVVPDGIFGWGLVGATSSNKMLRAALAGEWSSVPMTLCEHRLNADRKFLEGFLADIEDTSRLIVAAVAKYLP